jgi:hypothetical protein
MTTILGDGDSIGSCASRSRPLHARQPEIEQHQIVRMALQPGQRLGAITGIIHLEVFGEQAREREAQAPVVLDHEDGFGGGSGAFMA